MRLARNVLESVAGLEIFPIIGIIIFLGFFIGLIVYVVKMKKEDVEAFSQMPLTDEENKTFGTVSDKDVTVNNGNNKP